MLDIYKQRYPNGVGLNINYFLSKPPKKYDYITVDSKSNIKYDKWKESRKIEKLEDLPEYHVEAIKLTVFKILKNFPQITELYLTGSFVSGEWLDNTASLDERDLKMKVMMKCKNSDYDFISVPLILAQTKDYHLINAVQAPKIRIVMDSWNLAALPLEYHSKVVKAFKNNDYTIIYKLFKEYKVVSCDSCLKNSAIKEWMEFAVKTGMYEE